jgi:hypothetical protein
MTDNNHPMLPTQEQLTEWDSEHFDEGENFDVMMIKAFQAGADQELEACCEVLARELICDGKHVATDLRAVRRPKPKSLAEDAYDALDTYIYGNPDSGDKERTYNALRRALKRLQELEGQDDG